MKKILGVAAAGLVAVLALASSAAAVETVPGEGGVAPTSPGACSFIVDPAGSTVFPINVTVTVTAPVGVTASLFLDGVVKGGPTVVPASGTVVYSNVNVASANVGISVNYTYGNKNAYTTVCSGAGGEVVIRVKAEAATLAFTGSSSNTPTYVLVGIAAIVLGLVMVVGVRRRASVRG